jgi:hypothetical protein
MPRVRKPSPEQQKQHRAAATACATIVHVLETMYPGDVNLHMAKRCLDEFADSAIAQPKPRVRKPKATTAPEQRPFNPTSSEARSPIATA